MLSSSNYGRPPQSLRRSKELENIAEWTGEQK